ncbi:MAG TPA: MFS transporter [Gammaproteobacteria bacterium]|nr:MFS transporter [Gammaproteobacteria bacterium]
MGTENAASAGLRNPVLRLLWHRQLDGYPGDARRYTNLAIVVVVTITLYYQLYVAGAVAPSILRDYGMSFLFFVNLLVVTNVLGAFASLLAGLADRWGRANMVTWGLALTTVLTLFAVPNMPDKWSFAAVVSVVGFVEGIILVATPALVRDFSPQLGRASAMGFWTLGPVAGSLVVAEVSSHTLPVLHAWQDQFVICGIASAVVFLIALVGLRELAPGLRDQLMVSVQDRALIEARAQGVDIDESLRHPWRQMLHFDIIGSAFAISVFLLIYYTAVGFLVIYLTTIYGFSESQANALGNWFWAFDAGALIVTGAVSDWIGVRKPFMLAGAVGAIVMTILFLRTTQHPSTTFFSLAGIFSLLAMCLAIVYAPWMASFTETVERRNPALTATGLAVWGWIIRAVIASAFFALPFAVHSVTPLVNHGTQVARAAKAAGAQDKLVRAHPKLLHRVLRYPPDAVPHALEQNARAAIGASALASVEKVRDDLNVLRRYGPAVKHAEQAEATQWQDWWWICIGGEAVFIPLIFVMAGRWSPRRAREDARAHKQQVQREIEALSGTSESGP